jgi:hypothetical protein
MRPEADEYIMLAIKRPTPSNAFTLKFPPRHCSLGCFAKTNESRSASPVSIKRKKKEEKTPK